MSTAMRETPVSLRRGAVFNKADEQWKNQRIIWLNKRNFHQIQNRMSIDKEIIVLCQSENIICVVTINIVMRSKDTRIM